MYQYPGDVCDDLVGMLDKDSSQSDIYCHSPYCIYSKTLPIYNVNNTASATTSNIDGNTAPDVASFVKSHCQSSNFTNDTPDNGNWLSAGQLNIGDCLSAVQSPNAQQQVECQSRQSLTESDLTRSCPLPTLVECPSVPSNVDANDVQHQGTDNLLNDS
jgi:hypothetical protein